MKELVTFRLERAFETYEEAVLLHNNKNYFGTINRLYYAMFYAVTALSLKYNLFAKTHSGTKHLFSEHFINTNLFNKAKSEVFFILFEQRLKGDYDLTLRFSKEEVEPYFKKVKAFLYEAKRISET